MPHGRNRPVIDLEDYATISLSDIHTSTNLGNSTTGRTLLSTLLTSAKPLTIWSRVLALLGTA